MTRRALFATLAAALAGRKALAAPVHVHRIYCNHDSSVELLRLYREKLKADIAAAFAVPDVRLTTLPHRMEFRDY